MSGLTQLTVESKPTAIEPPARVELKDLTFSHTDQPTISGLTLSVREGELLCLLGPSGCGKTTTLNLLAGFLTPSRGQVLIDGRDITAVPVHKRGLGLVFQNYALFPHMTVFENVAFGLRRRRVGQPELRDAVEESLEAVRLEGSARKYPGELSGGEQQRVGLARALAVRPAVLLLDEPLSNLDAKLRREMQEQIRTIHEVYGLTSVSVTHDQEEALALSDRVAVMSGGRIEQIGGPHAIYKTPNTSFVSHFIGERVFLEGELTEAGGARTVVEVAGFGRVVTSSRVDFACGEQVEVTIPQDEIIVTRDNPNHTNSWAGRVVRSLYRGSRVQLIVACGEQTFKCQVDADQENLPSVGHQVWIHFPTEHVWVTRSEVEKG